MALLKNVEKKIWDVEGFAVDIKYPDGRNVRGDKTNFTMYPYNNGANNAWTLATWKAQRFYPHYQNYEVDVLDSDGSPVIGQTLLSTVRASYSEA